MSKLGKLVLLLILVAIVSFTFAGITLVRNEHFVEHINRNYDIESSGEFIDWLRMLGSDYDSTQPTSQFSVDDQIDFEMGGNIDKIDVDSIVANIIIKPSDGDLAYAELEGEIAYSGDVKPFLMVDESGETLTIKVMYGKNGSMNISQNDFELRVFLPREISSDIDIMSVSGDVQMLQNGVGELKIKTVSGSVEIEKVIADEIKVESVSGQVSIIQESIITDYTIKTVSGDVDVLVSEVSDLYLDYSAISGEGIYDYPFNQINEIDDNELELKRNSGEFEMRVRSTSGDLKLMLME
jgi:hypothetical protein